jgi:hypothetical protein
MLIRFIQRLDMTLNAAQTRKRKGEIVQSFLAELKDVKIGVDKVLVHYSHAVPLQNSF